MQESFLLVTKIELLIVQVSIPEEISDLYKEDIDFRKLKLHLQMLPDAVKSTPLDGIYVHKVTRVQTICDIFKYKSIAFGSAQAHSNILDHTCHYSNSRAKLFRP